NGERHQRTLVVTPAAIHDEWTAASVDALTPAEIDFLIGLKPEIVLLGTGARQVFPSIALLRAFSTANIGLQTVHTEAACRTYNILADEGRNVAAAVFTP